MFSFIISTYNRNEILSETLLSYIPFLSSSILFEIIVVDNHQNAFTKHLINDITNKHNLPIRYIVEPKNGLSNARNTGISHSLYDWIIFIDDDALVSKSYISNLNNILLNNNLKFIGGKYVPWYKYGKPIWFLDEWATSLNKPDKFSTLSQNQFIDGGNMIIHKSVFTELGDFNINLGMQGTAIGYGEEIEFQMRVRQKGIDIWYSPDLLIYHLVPKYKMSINWFLKSWYNHGLYYWKAYRVIPTNYNTGFGIMLQITNKIVLNLSSNFIKLFNKDYYIQNWIIDSLQIPAWEYGKLMGAKKYNQ
jgi:GT2 family glycosyltransferase